MKKFIADNDNNPADEVYRSTSLYARDLELRGWQVASIRSRNAYEFYAIDGVYVSDLLNEEAA